MNTANNAVGGGPQQHHHLQKQQQQQHIPGNAPTASPELTVLTPTNISSDQSTTKREPYLRNWFMSSLSSSPSAATTAASENAVNVPQHSSHTGAPNSPANTSLTASSSHALSALSGSDSSFPAILQPPLVDMTGGGAGSGNTTPRHASFYGAAAPHLDSQHSGSKHYYKGDRSHYKANNLIATSDNHPKMELSQKQQPQQQQREAKQPAQQKSSRRTTSLLNLFMSNSQGMEDR